MEDALNEAVLKQEKFFLGICIGMQFLSTFGTERGKNNGLGWIEGVVDAIPIVRGYPVPHMGWNSLHNISDSSILKGIREGDHMYFSHSYHFAVDDSTVIAAKTDYSCSIVAAVARCNIFGIQFHPEKSQRNGITVIKNFLEF